MRIRQVRPEFWTDETMAALAPAVRLFYIGLWNVADDAGWMEWRPSRIGAVLFPYEHPKKRERDIGVWSASLSLVGRLVLHDCGCGHIPTLSKHQRVTGKQSFQAFDVHKPHMVLSGKRSLLSDSPVTERYVTERNGMSTDELMATRDAEDRVESLKLVATGKLRR